MTTLTMAQIYADAREAGFDPASAVIMAAIAMGESGGNPDAMGDVNLQNGTWGPSVGLAQIRTLKSDTGTGRTRDIDLLRDPIKNLTAAFSISSGGKDFTPWTVYNTGKYRSFLGQAQSSAGAYVPGASVTAKPVGLIDGLTSGLLDTVRDMAFTGLAVMFGLGLIVAGTYQTWSPAVKSAFKVAKVAAIV
jgi:hypothetical protein